MSHASAVPDLPVVQTPAPAPSIPAESSISGVSNLLSGSGDDPLLASSPCKAVRIYCSISGYVNAVNRQDKHRTADGQTMSSCGVTNFE